MIGNGRIAASLGELPDNEPDTGESSGQARPAPVVRAHRHTFKAQPRPWRYDDTSRNVLAADGSIVCRVGDDVYGDPLIGREIVRVFNNIVA